MSLKRPFAGEESCKQGCYFINGTIMILSEKREKYENQKSTKCMSYFGMYSGNRTYRAVSYTHLDVYKRQDAICKVNVRPKIK